MHTSSIDRAVSNKETGHRPSSWKISFADASCLCSTYVVRTKQTSVEQVTARVRARMDDGASRVRVGEGRVADRR